MSGLALNTNVLTEHRTIRHMDTLLMNGQCGVYHQTNVAMEAMISSTQMPAKLMMIRFHLSATVHESVTLQYRAGEKHMNKKPISWLSPPNALQLSPWPNSWITFTMPSDSHMYIIVRKAKNSW